MDERFIAPLSIDLRQLSTEATEITESLLREEELFTEMLPITKLYHDISVAARELADLLDNLNS